MNSLVSYHKSGTTLVEHYSGNETRLRLFSVLLAGDVTQKVSRP